jgi:hypothetical protein
MGTPATFDGRAEDLESEPGSIVDDGGGGDPSWTFSALRK